MRIRTFVVPSIVVPLAAASACSSSSVAPTGETTSRSQGSELREAPQSFSPPPHPGPFIDPVLRMGRACKDEASCETLATNVYNPAVDAWYTPQFASFSVWKTFFGFSDDPTGPHPGEVRAVYYNNADLKFGRDMHCRPSVQNTAAIACYVSNYSADGSQTAGTDPHAAIANADSNVGRLASVAMLYDPANQSWPAGEKVQFWVFNGGRNGQKNDGSQIPAAILDSQGPKAVPGVCLDCHGGTFDAATNLVAGANFLPFDAPSFVFSDSNPNLSESAQREAIRALNGMVESTSSNSAKPGPTIAGLIDGWYGWCGGVGAAGCYIDDAGHPFYPLSWIFTGFPPGQLLSLYQTVPRRYCRTCHVALADVFDVEDYGAWSSQRGAVGNLVLQRGIMPFAQVPYGAFWSDSAAQSALESYTGVCPPGLTMCSGQCVDTTSDRANCGACGNSCGRGTCVNSECNDPPDCTTLGCRSGLKCCTCTATPECITPKACTQACNN
jgi:hypothetical protein